MIEQRDLFTAAAEAAEAGMTQVAENAGEEWSAMAYAWLLGYLRTHRTLFGDDLWESGLPKPHDMRALGAVVKRLAREGLIERDGYRPRASGNLTPAPVWRSLIYVEPTDCDLCGGERVIDGLVDGDRVVAEPCARCVR